MGENIFEGKVAKQKHCNKEERKSLSTTSIHHFTFFRFKRKFISREKFLLVFFASDRNIKRDCTVVNEKKKVYVSGFFFLILLVMCKRNDEKKYRMFYQVAVRKKRREGRKESFFLFLFLHESFIY